MLEIWLSRNGGYEVRKEDYRSKILKKGTGTAIDGRKTIKSKDRCGYVNNEPTISFDTNKKSI